MVIFPLSLYTRVRKTKTICTSNRGLSAPIWVQLVHFVLILIRIAVVVVNSEMLNNGGVVNGSIVGRA